MLNIILALEIMKKLIFIPLILLFASCLPDDSGFQVQEDVDFSAENEAEIIAYLDANNLTAERSDSGLFFIIENQGTGAQPTATSNVTVAYEGFFTDGTVFDGSEEGITFNLQQVIQGWTEGIPLFNEGGNGVLLIPARLGFGSSDFNGIPGGSVLIFNVTVISTD